MLYSILRPLLFSMPAEQAHHAALSLLDKTNCLRPVPNLHTSPTKVMGLNFPNKVGLAAGLDKNAAYVTALGKMGFGFIEVGTVTPRPQPGNPQPRLFRLPEQQAIINRMGFNNDGVEQLIQNVQRASYSGILGINIGKNKDTPNENAVDDYLICLEKVYPYADYITINISSPNTQGLRDLQHEDELKQLLDQLKLAQTQLTEKTGNYRPIVVKIAPDLTDEAVVAIGQTIKNAGMDGVIATNTTIDKTSVANLQHGSEEGGLSGVPVRDKSTKVIRLLADSLNGELPIIGVGGISSADDARDKLQAGASLVQVYTGLIYKGFDLVSELKNL